MKKLLLALALSLWFAPAHAQNTTCANRPNGDSTNACANTRFVQSAISGVGLAIGNSITGGTPGDILIVGAGPVLSQVGTTGSGNAVLATSPTLTTPNIGAAIGTSLSMTGGLTVFSATAPPSGGNASDYASLFSSTSGLGTYFGSGAPTLSAAAGSMYYRTDCSSVSTCAYVNTSSSTTWSALGSGGGGGSPGGSNTQVQYNNSSSFGGISGVTSNGTAMTFAQTDLILGSNSTGTITLTTASAGSSSFTATLPANTGTIGELNLAQTWSANQTYGSGNLQMNAATGFTHSDSTNGTITDLISNANSGSSALAAIEFTTNAGNAFLQAYGSNNTNGISGAGGEFELTNAGGPISLFTNAGEIVLLAQPTIATGGVFAPQNYLLSQSTTTFTGTTAVSAFSQAHLGRPTLTDTSAVTVTTANTFLIDNAPNCTGAGPVTCTNSWALNVAAGATNLQATTIGGALTTNITGGGTQCVQANNTGVLSGSGSGCGGGGGSATTVAPQGRLTLVTHTPVMTVSESAKTTIFYDSYVGNVVPVYNGGSDVLLTIGSNEISVALESSGSGGLNASEVFDVWAVNVSSTLTLCIANGAASGTAGSGWASDTGGSTTARGSGYSKLDNTTRSYITNANSITHCWNGTTDEGSITANEATYLGTFATTSSAEQAAFIFGAQASNGTAAQLLLWNQYNRVSVAPLVSDSTASWTYNTATIRAAHGSTTMRVTWVAGQLEDGVTARYLVGVEDTADSGTVDCVSGVGIDSTTTFATSAVGAMGTNITSAVGTTSSQVIGEYSGYVGLGLHFAQALEDAPGAGCTFFGGTTTSQNALTANIRM